MENSTTLHGVALSTAVERSQVIGVTSNGLELALWRDSAGALHAQQNRCPHRGMRLSFGFVRDDRLNCLYHGWSYDGGGRCRHIPAQPAAVPAKTICLRSHAVREQHGVIWLDATRDDGASPALLEEWPLPDGLQATPVRSLVVAASLAQVQQALAALTLPRLEGDADALTEHRPQRDAAGLLLQRHGGAARGLLYALQPVAGSDGHEATGLHVAALWPGEAPPAWRLALSRTLRRLAASLEPDDSSAHQPIVPELSA